jgi:hypothetical protein
MRNDAGDAGARSEMNATKEEIESELKQLDEMRKQYAMLEMAGTINTMRMVLSWVLDTAGNPSPVGMAKTQAFFEQNTKKD